MWVDTRPPEQKRFRPFFDQELPEVPVVGMIASIDISPDWELYAAAVFKTTNPAIPYLCVVVAGCSCWPDRGSTSQYMGGKEDMDKMSFEDKVDLIAKCQAANWEPTRMLEREDG